jgi:hypothetical protein
MASITDTARNPNGGVSGYPQPPMRLLTEITVFASDNGEGLLGETTDKLITFFALGVVIFFALVVILFSLLQGALEKRKEQRKAVDLRRRVGW